MEAKKVIVNHFCERRGLSQDAISHGLADMICAVTAPYLLMIECLDQLDFSDPSSGLLVKLVDRAYETVAGSLSLIALGHLREAEILSRSVYESAVTTAFISKDNPPARLAQFFRAYVKTEREQNRKWANELEGLPTTIRQDHQERIDNKNISMDHYDQFIDRYIAECEIIPEEASKWPGLIDRLTALGRRIDYRTVYAAMCSQAHHDAEDVLNHFFANSIEGADHLAERMEREADIFSIFMVLFGLQWFVQATLDTCIHLKFPTAISESRKSLKRITGELEKVAPLLDKGEFPNGWSMHSKSPVGEER